MRIGLVLDDSLDGTDGIQQYVITLGSWLTEQGHDVCYLVGQTTRSDIAGIYSLSRNIKVRFNGNRLSVPLPTAKKELAKVLNELKLDILHVQAPYSPFMSGRLVQLVSKKTAVVGTFHIMPYGKIARLGSDILGKINTKTARRFDMMMAVSKPAQVFAGKHYGFTCIVVPNPINLKAIRHANSLRTSTNIVFLGRLVERKGPLELLKAVNYMVEHKLYPGSFMLRIGGKGPLNEKLKAYAASAGWDFIKQCEFLGYVSEKEKPHLLAGADIAVFPSTGGESFGISLLEGLALARGVVVAGNNPGYASVMHGFETQLVNPKDTANFAKTLARFLNEESDRAQIASAQKTYVQQFDIGVIGPEIVSVYNQALQKRRAS